MGADERLLQPQAAAFPGLCCLPWKAPEPGETIRHYASRMLDAVPVWPCVLGGISFGGVVAQEMAALRPPRALILISTFVSPDEIRLPSLPFAGGPLAGMAPALSGLAKPCRGLLPAPERLVLEMLASSDPAFLAWATRNAPRWSPPPPAAVPTLRLHGTYDRLIRPRHREGITFVEGAGHLANLTHAAFVNGAVAQFLQPREQTSR